jgi:hypothetical protein
MNRLFSLIEDDLSTPKQFPKACFSALFYAGLVEAAKIVVP